MEHRISELLEVLGISLASFKNLEGFRSYLDVLAKLIDCSNQIFTQYQREAKLLAHFDGFSDAVLEKLEYFVVQYDKCRNWLLGYLFKGTKVEQLNREFRESFANYSFEDPHRHLRQLHVILYLLKQAENLGYVP